MTVTGFDTEDELVQSYIRAANDEIIRSSGDLDSTPPVLAGIVFTNLESNETLPPQIQVRSNTKNSLVATRPTVS